MSVIGRPTKLTEQFIQAADEVINKGINSIIFTDAELLSLINDKLPEESRICERTFIRWKQDNKAEQEMDEIGTQFCHLIKRALKTQKESLFNRLQEDDKSGSWQRWAWIIERKFDDWNIRHKTELSSDPINPIRIVEVKELGGNNNDTTS